jgi:6-phosphogluconate dehydrogenase (decarboxylating)
MSVIAPNIHSVVDRDGAVILDVEHDLMVTLNSTGAYVWEKLRQGRIIDEIISDLATDSDTDIATVDRDVRAFMDQLTREKLLKKISEALP